MRFFSKITFICNCCFVLAVILRWVDIYNKKNVDFDGAITVQPLQSTTVVLGYGAIFINLLFLISHLLVKSFNTRQAAEPQQSTIHVVVKQAIPAWLIRVNVIFFIIQLYYFFFTS